MKTEFFMAMMPPTKQWKDVVGYEGLYKVNQNGEIYSKYSKRILKPYISSDGYLRVNLCKNKKARVTMLHRIVAEAFVPNPLNMPVVNHIDGDKSNPRVENLEWTTYSQNSIHAYSIGLSHISKKCRDAVSKIAAKNGAKTTSKSISQFDKQGNFIHKYPSIREASRDTGICRANISRATKQNSNSAGGYIWVIH